MTQQNRVLHKHVQIPVPCICEHIKGCRGKLKHVEGCQQQDYFLYYSTALSIQVVYTRFDQLLLRNVVSEIFTVRLGSFMGTEDTE